MRLVLLLLALLIFFYILGGGVCGNKEPKELQAYVTKANELADKSNDLAKAFNGLRTPDVTRKELDEKLSRYSKEGTEIAKKAAELEVPKALERAHFYLNLAFDLRASALKSYRPAVFNALKDEDLDVASGQVALVLKDLSLSDRTYSLYVKEAKQVLKEKRVFGISPVSSAFLPKNNYEKAELVPYLQQLKGIKSLEEVHGLAITEISVSPRHVGYNAAKKLFVLPSTVKISAIVTVENQGNQPENRVPVKATLKSETEPKEKVNQVIVDTIAPNERKTIEITNLKPTSGSIVNLLTITVGPVPNEKLVKNNVKEFKFIVR